ncbi:abscission/NoCut checkpoint regulator-like [Teratosphaeria destructans]|uniref:Abscission/NoCut checkpoint regulator-like n=1 Tax=Teratosphaeria destructans TaxID=418781 RepID=A0A9W7VYT5_9PEZI|nr:abscission/NoCut checkpoint regulator-like [Teratosphaeria destructans]
MKIMSGHDDKLLARLNALKPSTISFSTAPKASIDVEVNHKPQTVEDKLADRLKALRASSPSSASNRSTGSGDRADELTAQVRGQGATKRDPIRDWQAEAHDAPDLDALLQQIGDDEQWKLNPDDPKDVKKLMKEARAALAEREEDAEDAGNVHVMNHESSGSRDGHLDEEADEGRERSEEEEASDYVKQVLAELEMDAKYGATATQDHEKGLNTDHDRKDFDLPATPSNLPQPSASTEPPSYEDSELEARFSKLGLELPSTPTAPPSAHPKVTASINRSGKRKSTLPTYTEEDIDSWCCICNEDGELKCLGCDGDLYCGDCWSDGHGNGPGQERGHRAVQYVRKGRGGLTAA